MNVINLDILYKVICQRKSNSHKGDFGKILAIGGNVNYGGAIIMATSAAIHAGAGLVTCATNIENLSSLHSIVPEAMYVNFFDKVSLLSAINSNDVIIIGPGLGTSESSREILAITLSNLSSKQICIIDGSAITLISEDDNLKSMLTNNLNIIYTPHQMEWQRLSGIDIEDQHQQQQLNLEKQRILDATVILKKHHTTIYHRDGELSKLKIGGPFMATGGMGDTLTGILAAFIVQFKQINLNSRIDAAVFSHSYIAELLSKEKYITLPTDIIKYLPKFMAKIAQQK